MEFHEITPEEGRWARPLLLCSNSNSCEYSFLNIYMWKRVFHSVIAQFEDFVVARSEGQRLHYLFPAGKGDMSKVLDAILKDAFEAGKNPILFSLTSKDKLLLEDLYPGKFHYEQPREESDYIYSAADLASLPGRAYQKKRNHCSRFERSYPDWEFHEITAEAVAEIAEFNNLWCNLYDNRNDEGIAEEHIAIEQALRHYDELQLKGGYITTGGRIVAFSFGSPLNENMFVTHVEKALYDVAGSYNIINREMARRFAGSYQYINRENDVGEEGLRTAKLSYNPVFLEHKYTAEWIIK